MKLEKTNAELDRMLTAIRSLADTPLPAKTGYLLAKLRIAIEDALKAFREATDSIIKKYSDGGETLQVNKNDDPETYAKVLAELGDINSEVTAVEITLIPIEYFDGHDIPFSVIDALSSCIKDGDDDDH